MFAVVFEVKLAPGGEAAYLKVAEKISAMLLKQDGFISIERFRSINEEGKGLSLSFWESEAAIDNWRNQLPHRDGQQKGKDELFSEYRVRVAQVMRDYINEERSQAPADSMRALG